MSCWSVGEKGPGFGQSLIQNMASCATYSQRTPHNEKNQYDATQSCLDSLSRGRRLKRRA